MSIQLPQYTAQSCWVPSLEAGKLTSAQLVLHSRMPSLTGIVFVQCILYYKLYPGDFLWTKVLVRLYSLSHDSTMFIDNIVRFSWSGHLT